MEKDFDQALYHFRERVKRKSGDEDEYAKQAMQGIRLILESQNEESTIN